MIFVTVGTSVLQFNRLLKIIDEFCEEGVIDKDDVIVQVGRSDYKPKNYKYFDFVSREEHHKYLENSDLIITHSGTGSVISSIKAGKKVIAFPRLKKFGEHVDDHQVDLVKAFVKDNYILVAMNKEELKKQIMNIDSFKPTKFVSNNEKLVGILIDFIERQ